MLYYVYNMRRDLAPIHPDIDFAPVFDILGGDEDIFLKIKVIGRLACGAPVYKVAKEMDLDITTVRNWQKSEVFQNAYEFIRRNLSEYIRKDLDYCRIQANEWITTILSKNALTDNDIPEKMRQVVLKEQGLAARFVHQQVSSVDSPSGSGATVAVLNLDASAARVLADRLQEIKDITDAAPEKEIIQS